jgi:hypothetical protein
MPSSTIGSSRERMSAIVPLDGGVTGVDARGACGNDQERRGKSDQRM